MLRSFFMACYRNGYINLLVGLNYSGVSDGNCARRCRWTLLISWHIDEIGKAWDRVRSEKQIELGPNIRVFLNEYEYRYEKANKR